MKKNQIENQYNKNHERYDYWEYYHSNGDQTKQFYI